MEAEPARTPSMPLTWPAAMFGLMFGVAMTYAPYEFHAAYFRPLYPYVRPMGVAFLASSIVLLATMLYRHAPRWLDVLGRVGFGAVTGLYWWMLNVRTGSLTGAILYPLLLAGVALETSPSWRKREVFRGVVALVALSFGLLMLVAREHFPPVFHASLSPLLVPLGLVFLGCGAGLLAPLDSRWPPLPRVLFGLLAVAFALHSWGLSRIGMGPAATVYVIFTLSCAAASVGFRPRAPHTVGFKLLRGLAFAGLVPLLALGGLAARLAQGAIERQVRDDTVRAAAGEADFLVRYLDDARESLQLLLESPGFRSAFLSRDRKLLELYLRNLPAQARAFDAALAVDKEGAGLAASYGKEDLGSFSHRDFHGGVLSTGAPYVSRPYISQLGLPHVAVALPFKHDGKLEGMLVGLLSLERLSAAVTPAAQRFRVQVLDRRGLLLLRDTQPGAPLLSEAHLPGALRLHLSSNDEGVVETFGPEDQRILLAADAPVPGTEWSVVVTQDMGVAYRAITRTSVAFIALLALGVVLMLALSQFVARDIIRRLETLVEATAAIGRGELSRRVPEEENDELGGLCRGFNEMASRTEAAQAELREAVRLREEFLSVASHELRTPLTPLKGFAALTLSRMERGGDFPERERTLKALRSMARQTDRLTRLVDDLLDTSRIQAGRFELERARVDLVPLVREVIERFELRGDDGLRFLLEAPEVPVEGIWDGPRLEQVVTNLLSNAVRYSPHGGSVRVSFHLTPEAVELRVRDEGIGIPSESIALLFQPFARASNATARHFGGLGLGLFICREIIQRHGGAIWAESPGAQLGSCFHVRLPRELPAPSTAAATA
ncbi:ATP-binding protein [Vitiosangium sp. GDMCC 1.1324]|uniref:sensor histidine kinase n=1 Tax=Vitiosangium sp. (strain GDMCC 1.1324) TaxID=2138576 RepID=UPI000D33D048|nr:ATP-binding protein [Vitiosangium sp. GDMCC 1.1324]PTL84861.1 histidine kinase [Vitiosangium sp. GDMCC 1.1324]